MSIAVRRQSLPPQTVLPPHTHAAPMLAVVLRGAAELRLPHVARTFRAAHGESIAASLRRRRVLWAAERLAAGREPLSAIALAAGFCDQAHFCRIFRKVTGRTPGSVRRRI